MIQRVLYLDRIRKSLQRSRVVALQGPRQCGKTTLARMIAGETKAVYYDLENPFDRSRLTNPMMVLQNHKGLVIIDEVQTMPELFPILRVLADRKPLPAKFLVLGSSSSALTTQSSESLAGRIEFIEMSSFILDEIDATQWKKLFLRGGYPRSFLAKSREQSFLWRQNYVTTFLERDLPQAGLSLPMNAMHRFWSMIAHCHGQRLNFSEIGRSLGISDNTVRRYLDVLSSMYIVRQLAPWFENLQKRQVKTPKVYFRDSGLLNLFWDIDSYQHLLEHPKCGAAWEGFALEYVITLLQPRQAYYWATQNGAELDLFFTARGKRYGFEFKFSESPVTTASMKTALKDLRLDMLYVVHPGIEPFPIEKKISVLPLHAIREEMKATKLIQ